MDKAQPSELVEQVARAMCAALSIDKSAICQWDRLHREERELYETAARAAIERLTPTPEPIPMVLFCPRCGLQHIDEPHGDWDNPPHRSHLCHGCGCIWRPADVPTNGVRVISTAGTADNWPASTSEAMGSARAATPEPCRVREDQREALAYQLFRTAFPNSSWMGAAETTKQLYRAKIDSALSASPAEPEEATEAWQPIETAPKDGREVWVKRVHDGRTVKEGWAVFSSLSTSAPMRQWADGGMDEPIPPDHDAADVKRWCNPDRLHRFPTPTHWMSEPPAMHSAAPIGGK